MNLTSVASRLSSFWAAGLWAGIFGLLFHFSWRLTAGVADPQVAAVVALFFWILLLLGARRHLVARTTRVLEADPEAALDSEPGALLRGHLATSGEELGNATDEEVVEQVEEELSAWYLPVHALVWSLPATGFLGTAWHLRAASRSVFAGGGEASIVLDGAAFAEIAERVSSAFLIIYLALGFAVLAYIATALSMRTEYNLLRRLRRLSSREPEAPQLPETAGVDATA